MRVFYIRAVAILSDVSLWVGFLYSAITGPHNTPAEDAAGHGPLYANPNSLLWMVGAILWIFATVALCLNAEHIMLTPFEVVRWRRRRLRAARLERIGVMERELVAAGLIIPRDEFELKLAKLENQRPSRDPLLALTAPRGYDSIDWPNGRPKDAPKCQHNDLAHFFDTEGHYEFSLCRVCQQKVHKPTA